MRLRQDGLIVTMCDVWRVVLFADFAIAVCFLY